MKNRINLKNFNIHTDLVIDNDIKENNVQKKKINDNLQVTTIQINEDLATELNRKTGNYITIEFIDTTNYEDKIEIGKCLENELKYLFSKQNILETDPCLILGLGNRFSTADSLGPITIDKVMVTRHLFLLNTNVKNGIRCVSAISPGVMANTGIETYDIITSLIEKIKPKFLIVVDALASSSIERINKTIQITDTGIHPGSGIGNNRQEISYDTVGIPVIAIGVPTVVESSILVNDTIDYIFKHLSYIKNNFDVNKLIIGHRDGKKYLNTIQKQNLSLEEKIEVSGILGTLDEEKKKELICEVLNSIDYNMIVTPKEIDDLIENMKDIVARGINFAV